MTERYVRPQENGNRCDVEWVMLRDLLHNLTLHISAMSRDQPLSFSTHHHFPEDFDDGDRKLASHFETLRACNATSLNLDLIQSGVGGTNSWGAARLPEFSIPYQSWSFGFWMVVAG